MGHSGDSPGRNWLILKSSKRRVNWWSYLMGHSECRVGRFAGSQVAIRVALVLVDDENAPEWRAVIDNPW